MIEILCTLVCSTGALQVANLRPRAVNSLFPQRYFALRRRYSEHVARQRPAFHRQERMSQRECRYRHIHARCHLEQQADFPHPSTPSATRAPLGSSRVVHTHADASSRAAEDPSVCCVQMSTVPSCEQLAMVLHERPMPGAHATSRTHSSCPSSTTGLALHVSPTSVQILICRSHPHDTSRGVVVVSAVSISLLPKDPIATSGAQLTDVTPLRWAPRIRSTDHRLSFVCVKIDMSPSADAHAKTARPMACGAHATAFTDPSCSTCSLVCSHPTAVSFQISTFRSCEHDASRFPKFGCDHPTIQTGPSCPCNSLTSLCCPSSATSNILTVRSEAHVAKRFP
eukprot:m.857208 g.857208  ORF g.857208 m.857208 type:complete len:340 (-) comp23519_c0_seq20:334-1353(-)